MADNNEYTRGFGRWIFNIYQPLKEIGPYTGTLIINKDYHIVENKTKEGNKYCLISIPSPNVSYVVNELIKQEDKLNVVQTS